MQILNTVFALLGLSLVAIGMPTTANILATVDSLLPANTHPTAHTQHLLLNRDDATTTSNFSDFCGNMWATSDSTISAECNPTGYNLGATLSHSHIDMNSCFTNSNGTIQPQRDGNAMDSCTLGKQGRLACPDQTCAEDTFVVYCEDLNGVNITQWVDMDAYMWAKYNENSELVIGCLDSVNDMVLGDYDECTHDGATSKCT